jgi:soluble lytic murein transglycosylase-like protein
MRKALLLACLLSITHSLPSSIATASKPVATAKVLPSRPIEYIWLEIVNSPAASHEEMVLTRKMATKYKAPVEYILAIITTESAWRSLAIGTNKNDTKDSGLMQLNSRNYEEFKWRFNNYEDYDPLNSETNLQIGIQYLVYLYEMLDDWSLAIAAYNCGPTAVRNNKIPASTTRYVAEVLELARRLEYARD